MIQFILSIMEGSANKTFIDKSIDYVGISQRSRVAAPRGLRGTGSPWRSFFTMYHSRTLETGSRDLPREWFVSSHTLMPTGFGKSSSRVKPEPNQPQRNDVYFFQTQLFLPWFSFPGSRHCRQRLHLGQMTTHPGSSAMQQPPARKLPALKFGTENGRFGTPWCLLVGVELQTSELTPQTA
jgi:hypothetical protein